MSSTSSDTSICKVCVWVRVRVWDSWVGDEEISSSSWDDDGVSGVRVGVRVRVRVRVRARVRVRGMQCVGVG